MAFRELRRGLLRGGAREAFKLRVLGLRVLGTREAGGGAGREGVRTKIAPPAESLDVVGALNKGYWGGIKRQGFL